MAKADYIKILDTAFNSGIPFINITEFYSYALIPQGPDKWLEVSYDLEEKSPETRVLNSTKAFNMFCEEVEKGLSEAIPDFQLFKWKEFKNKLTGSDEVKLTTAIKEITANASSYSSKLPVVLHKNDLAKVTDKI